MLHLLHLVRMCHTGYMSTQTPYTEALVPTASDIRLALASSQVLAKHLGTDNALTAHVQLTANGIQVAEIDLPLPIVRLLLGVLEEMAAGSVVTLLPLTTELTSRQTAERLRVSRPSLIKMLDAGKIPYRKVGAHRRVRSEDAMRYLQNERTRRAQVMEELAAETKKLGLYE